MTDAPGGLVGRRYGPPRGHPFIDGARELLVLDGLREGVPYGVIAKAAGVSVRTVQRIASARRRGGTRWVEPNDSGRGLSRAGTKSPQLYQNLSRFDVLKR